MPYKWIVKISIILTILLILPVYDYSKDKPPEGIDNLKKACINAAIKGMKLEIGRNKMWIKHNKDEKRKEEFKKRIKQLEAEITKYQNINIKEYEIPPKKKMETWFEGKCRENAILYFDELSRSGPWYHITGIRGNNYNAIKPKTKYQMVFYLVYPREYAWMQSFYIYLDQFKP